MQEVASAGPSCIIHFSPEPGEGPYTVRVVIDGVGLDLRLRCEALAAGGDK